MILLERLIAALFGAWLVHRAEVKLKKEKDEAQIERISEAISTFKKARTREEKVLANKKLSDSLAVK